MSRPKRLLAAAVVSSALLFAGAWAARAVWPRGPGVAVRMDPGGVVAVAFRPGGSVLAVGREDGVILLVDPTTGRPVCTIRERPRVERLTFTADGHSLIVAGGPTVRVRDANTGALTAEPRVNPGNHSVCDLAMSPDGRLLVVGLGTAAEWVVWDLAAGSVVRRASGEGGRNHLAAFSPDGSILALANSRSLQFLETATGQRVRHLTWEGPNGSDSSAVATAFRADGRKLFVATSDREVWVWDVDRGTRDAAYPVPRFPGHPLAVSPDGRLLAGSDKDREVRLYDAATGEVKVRQPWGFPPHNGYLTGLAFSPDGRLLAVAGTGGARVFELPPAR